MGEPVVPMEGLDSPHESGTSNNGAATANGISGRGGTGMKNRLRLSVLWESNTLFDAWLVGASGQIGFALLTMPYTLSQMGYAWGICACILYGCLGTWTVYLLVWLYLEFKARLDLQGKVPQEKYILQYHEVIGGLIGKWGRNISYFFIFITLCMTSIIQIVAAASNLYYANGSLDKRDWTFVVGGIAFLAVLVPDFAHFRTGAFIGVITTIITSVYLLVAALSLGQKPGVKHTGASDKVNFFTGVANLLSTFGGHNITIELLETMRRPSLYKYANIAVLVYALAVTIPSGVAVYWSAGDILLNKSNAFSVLPRSTWQTLAISTLVIHQVLAFVLFTHPIFLFCEKAVGVHTKAFYLRALSRVPAVALLVFVALAVPFFGPINSLLGSFGVAFGSYSIPTVAFLIVYRSKSARENSPLKPPWFLPTWSIMQAANVLILMFTIVVGIGWGGWAGIANLIRQIHTFGFFDKCFQCPPKPK